MKKLDKSVSNEEIIDKINEIITYIEKWQISMLEDEIRRLRYKQESDIFFNEKILPIVGGFNEH